jgi:UPF0716 protein FxsA
VSYGVVTCHRYAAPVATLTVVLLLAVPVLELWVFVQVAVAVGFWWALLALVGLSVGGAWLVKREGLAVWARLRDRVARGETPERELADGAVLLVAGLLLLFPGFVTGLLGLLLLLPPVRALVRPMLLRRVAAGGTFITATYRVGGDAAGHGTVVDTSATEVRGELES